MKVRNEGLTLWLSDEENVSETHELFASLAPTNPSNICRLYFRRDGGVLQTLQGEQVESTAESQSFRFVLPCLSRETSIQYRIEGGCVGRTVTSEWQSVRLKPRRRPTGHADDGAGAAQAGRLPFQLEYLCRFQIGLGRGPEVIGPTPEGLKVNWYPSGGVCKGPRLNGVLRAEGGDWMTIRPDGVGILGVRATVQTNDGALIYATYSGVFELGENGYENFLNGNLPKSATTKDAPMFITAAESYLWINRLQCIGIGLVHLDKLIYDYDLYALR